MCLEATICLHEHVYRKQDETISYNPDDFRKLDEYYYGEEYGQATTESTNTCDLVSIQAVWLDAMPIHYWFVKHLSKTSSDDDGLDLNGNILPLHVLRKLKNDCISVLKSLDGCKIRVSKKWVDEFKSRYKYYRMGNEVLFPQRITFDGKNYKKYDYFIFTKYHNLPDSFMKKAKQLLPDINLTHDQPYTGEYLRCIYSTIEAIDKMLNRVKKSKDKKCHLTYHFNYL